MSIRSNQARFAAHAARISFTVLLVTGLTLLALGVAVAISDGKPTSAQDIASCEVIDLGTLGSEPGASVSAEGNWSTEDCDSGFHLDSDAHNYKLQIDEPGRFRIDLKSDDADSFLYLLDAEGTRLADNDDGGGRLDARIELELVAGEYRIEATTVGGRRQGAADFTLTISRVEGCEPIHLGALELGADLETTGTWTLDTCGSRFVAAHPAFSYTFDVAIGGRVRIDLRSTEGDPVLSLVSPTRGLISANDDGGQRRNSRIERYLEAGTYLIEATTYWERDAQLASADFDLEIHLIDEQQRQESGFQLKIESSVLPEYAIAGVPFDVQYRIGNVGNGDMAAEDGTVEVFALAPRNYKNFTFDVDSETGWQAGVSYHSDDSSASSTSSVSDQVTPFQLTINSAGDSWVWLVVVIDDESGEEIGFHGQWRELKVLSSMPFDESVVAVDEVEYSVSTETDDEGEVSVLVAKSDDADAEVDATVRAKAIYTAGIGNQYVEGIFDRAAIAELKEAESATVVSVFDPSSQTLSIEFAEQYASALAASKLDESLQAGTALDPGHVEDLVLSNADYAVSQYSNVAKTFDRIHGRWEDGHALWFTEALAVHSLVAYTESVISPTVQAGEIVRAARDADEGWEDADVKAMVDALSADASCRSAGSDLRTALQSAGQTNVDELLEIDGELRLALPLYGMAVDAVLCKIAAIDDANDDFVNLLSPADYDEISSLIAPTTEVAQQPTKLRIVARLAEDGRTEHGVEIVGTGLVSPDIRFLSARATTGVWYSSSEVMFDEESIGKIRTRRLSDGRLELGFVNTGGDLILPDIRYVSAEIGEGVWIRSGEIEIPFENSLE